MINVLHALHSPLHNATEVGPWLWACGRQWLTTVATCHGPDPAKLHTLARAGQCQKAHLRFGERARHQVGSDPVNKMG